MKKKIIIISSIVLISFISISWYLIYAHSLEKNVEENIKVVNKKEPEKEKIENSVDNSEKNVEENFEESKIEEKEYSYTHNSKNETKEQDSYTQQTEKKEEIKKDNTQKTEKPTSNNQSSTPKEEVKKEETSKSEDERLWEEFKKDPLTLMILDADAPDWESKKEQQAEAKKWIDLGYRVEEPYACINFSSGERCVYSLLVFMSKGVCNETPTEIKIDWRKKNYIGIVAYAKSLGYECKGYQD
ncbi:MAG: hypothetical protein IKL65_06335 [Bacilli bacterium]|nr:hypothetical protein [Bacilli bacterium]